MQGYVYLRVKRVETIACINKDNSFPVFILKSLSHYMNACLSITFQSWCYSDWACYFLIFAFRGPADCLTDDATKSFSDFSAYNFYGPAAHFVLPLAILISSLLILLKYGFEICWWVRKEEYVVLDLGVFLRVPLQRCRLQ